jgi:hypothetical protein
VFWIASMTKAITATAAMQLIEQGNLSLTTQKSRRALLIGLVTGWAGVLKGPAEGPGLDGIAPPRRSPLVRAWSTTGW